ncbi:DUF1941 family protein [Diplocarpon rosae]|nr:DUF1941 family protein [Diplocarpon rosae]
MSDPRSPEDESPTFERIQDLLKAKDDTSRFVGLALLKTVLDNGQLVQNQQKLQALWESMSPKFLDRLLRAQQTEKVNKTDSKDMVDLAVAVIHTFSILLSEESRREKRLTGRIAPTPETTKLILQTLLTIVSQPDGASEILALEDLSPLIEITNQYPLALEIFEYSWTNASTVNAKVQTVRRSIDQVIPKLILNFRGTDAVTFIAFLGNTLVKLESEAVPTHPEWLGAVLLILRKLVTSKPTAAGRAAYTQLSAALLQAYPASCPSLLFKDDALGESDSKPFPFLLVNLLLTDIRSSFPSLLEKLNSAEYPSVSQRLAAAFDVISSYIGFLVRSLDDEDGSGFNVTPDLLLKLRKDIAETMSLTIEYLRDRWDASVAGASGLHPSARTGTAVTSEGTRLTLTWESMKDDVNADPLILAGIRALAIWIREDENENLRMETAGLMDMLVELYKSSSQSRLDFRYPILLALEGILVTEEALDGFLHQDGWQIVFQDLQSISRSTSDNATASTSSAEASRGLQIIRVLLAIVDHEAMSSPRDDWMMVVATTTSMKISAATLPSTIIEFQIAMIQLSVALLGKLSGGMRRRYFTSQPALSGLAKQLRSSVECLEDEAESREFMELLNDISLDIENL